MPATLRDLADALPGAERRGDATVVDATHDSRQAGPGWLFCAMRGEHTDGHAHAPPAVANGASALLVERWLEDLDVPQVRVPDTRAVTGVAASVVHDRPTDDLAVVGVTGTNGKTTTAYLVEAAVAAGARGTGLIGTVETRIHGAAVPGVRTTPEGTDLQRLFARMRDRDVDVVAMEISSHGLALRRIDGTRVAVAVFTNLSQDHLDFHGDMHSYAAAKARLFTPTLAERGIVDVEDDWGRWMVAHAGIPVVTVGPRGTDVRRRLVRADLDGTVVRLEGPAEVLGGTTEVEVATSLVGAFNGRNVSDAFLAAVAVGTPADAALAGLAACPGAPGRLDRVDVGQPFHVFVDYAHTPDAIRAVVDTLRPLADGRVLVVVGAGGDRDRAQRPMMGAAAAAADVAVLTSDNPRSEDPAAILDAVVGGARDAGTGAEVVTDPDRRRAIAAALERARPGDVVVVAGKGHEAVQEFADRTEPFDDRQVAAELLGARAPSPVEGAA
jgi:UDP-N-acetylmuramoyl-L-alanyl-D-glutamate--2,6-diaminopimelate ligase